MNREKQFAAELNALRTLCNESYSRVQQLNLLNSVGKHRFQDAEHQVVWESIRFLLPRGPISLSQLRVHLNNRGFPDTDVEKYFEPPMSAAVEREFSVSPAFGKPKP